MIKRLGILVISLWISSIIVIFVYGSALDLLKSLEELATHG